MTAADTPTSEKFEGEDISPASRNGLWERYSKIEDIRAAGREPFPHLSFNGRVGIETLISMHTTDNDELSSAKATTHRVAGRITRQRKHGKVHFLDLWDESGSIELRLTYDALGESAYSEAQVFDVGDIIGAEGTLTTTRRGEPLVQVSQCILLAKSLRQPPTDRPQRGGVSVAHVNRELDLLASEETREAFRLRARTTSALRRAMDDHGFVDVETPILQSLAGGANARPFVTRAHSLNRTLALRISAELYIRRCVVGGLERVYDMGKCFRNEGISHHHSPEFTMLEWSMCYTDYRDVASFVERLVAEVTREVLGTTIISRRGRTIDLAPPWQRCSLREKLVGALNVDCMAANRDELADLLDEPITPGSSWGEVVSALYGKYVEPHLIEPTIIFDFPIESFPLVKRHPEHPALGETFDVVIDGLEIASGDTELNDPEEQENRFLEQTERTRGEGHPHPHDAQYVRALEYGVPPSAGAGIGIERLLLILSGSESIREVIPFPALSGRR